MLAAAFTIPAVKPAPFTLRRNGKSQLQAEYLESREFCAEEIARIYGVPVRMIANV